MWLTSLFVFLRAHQGYLNSKDSLLGTREELWLPFKSDTTMKRSKNWRPWENPHVVHYLFFIFNLPSVQWLKDIGYSLLKTISVNLFCDKETAGWYWGIGHKFFQFSEIHLCFCKFGLFSALLHLCMSLWEGLQLSLCFYVKAVYWQHTLKV